MKNTLSLITKEKLNIVWVTDGLTMVRQILKLSLIQQYIILDERNGKIEP
jgi:hypothetical protein